MESRSHAVTQSDVMTWRGEMKELTVILGSVGPDSLKEGASVLSGNIFLRRLRRWSSFSDSKSPRRFSLFSPPELPASTSSVPVTASVSWARTEARKYKQMREKFILTVVMTGQLMVLTDTS